MTDDIELLPLPKKSVIDRHLPTGVRVYGYTSDDMRCYASACVSHATAAKDAEIEALREVADRMTGRVKWEECDCGCPNAKKPVDAASVIWLRAAAMVRAALKQENDDA